MLHRTQWSLLLIWKATFRVSTHPPAPHAPHVQGSFDNPRFDFHRFFVAGSWVCSVCLAMNLSKEWVWDCVVSEPLELKGLSIGYHRPDTMSETNALCPFGSAQPAASVLQCWHFVVKDSFLFLLFSFIKSNDGSRSSLRLVGWNLALFENNLSEQKGSY